MMLPCRRDRPRTAAACAERVLAAVACDEDVASNKQLVLPLLRAVGRRTVQRHLIAVIEHGIPHKKVCAVRAWYRSQVGRRLWSARSAAAPPDHPDPGGRTTS